MKPKPMSGSEEHVIRKNEAAATELLQLDSRWSKF